MLEANSIHTFEDLALISDEWSELHRAARPGSVFEHPAWARTWAEQFLSNGDLECVTIRDPLLDGALIGIAPLYRKRYSAAGVIATCIQPLGTGRHEELTEVVQVLSLPDRLSAVMPAVVHHLEALPHWNWLQLSLGPGQRWFMPEWLEHRADYLLLHRVVRPCVLMRAPLEDPVELLRSLKRNVRESLRRGRNRTKKLGGVALRCETEVDAVSDALQHLTALHRQRSQMKGKVAHADMLAKNGQLPFLLGAVRLLAVAGLARVHVAAHDGRDVAALLVVSDGDTDYVSITGLDPDYWDLNLNTLLLFEVFAKAGALRRSAVNLSTGPDVSKLRWSTEIVTYNDFVVVRGDFRSRWLYGAYSHLSLVRRHHQERVRHRIRVPKWTPAASAKKPGQGQ